MSEAISNPQGFGGYTDLQTICEPVIRPFRAGGTITALQAVYAGTNLRITSAATDCTASKVVGIALEGGASGKTIRVVTWGPVEAVPIAGTVAEGDIVKRSVTTSGRVSATATPGVGEALGWAIAAGSGANGTCSIFVAPAKA